ncbi:MAG: TasA family protein [Acutalibacteraceae bacterium]
MKSTNESTKKLTAGVVTIILLILCLCVTTLAIVYATVSVDNNLFSTGSVKINLNDGKPVIEEHEFLFEPGMTVKKDFFIENNATWDVYYKIYFDNVEGDLADVLEITIKDGDRVLYSGNATKLSRYGVRAADDTLKLKERRDLSVYFHYPESADNSTQNLTLSFDLCADAVQTKNNPNKLFD